MLFQYVCGDIFKSSKAWGVSVISLESRSSKSVSERFDTSPSYSLASHWHIAYRSHSCSHPSFYSVNCISNACLRTYLCYHISYELVILLWEAIKSCITLVFCDRDSTNLFMCSSNDLFGECEVAIFGQRCSWVSGYFLLVVAIAILVFIGIIFLVSIIFFDLILVIM